MNNLINYNPKKLLLLSFISFIFVIDSRPVYAGVQQDTTVQEKLAKLEVSSDGKIGISATNTANNMHIQYRAKDHFPFQSTFKVIGVSAILKQGMTNSHLLQQKVTYKKRDLFFWSPITEKHLTDGMTIFDLCAAAIMYSDDTAINLLMKKLGGTQTVVVFARSIGDNTFRLDHWEPNLNSDPKNLQDTSTPAAMEKSLQKLALGNALSTPQQNQLVTWMKGNTTGDARIRAGVPRGWIVADKTGSGDYGITNDIGIIWPTKCAPIIIAIYVTHNKKDAAQRDDIIAEATRILVNEFAKTDSCIKRNLT